MKFKNFDLKKYETSKKLKEILEENNLKVYSFKNFDEEIDGFTDRKVICINGDKNFYTKRFSLCHELGHNILNHKFGDSREEKEADNFACNILVDDYELKEKVRDGWCLSDLEKLFGVPQKEIQKRIYQIFDKSELNFCF